MPSPTGSPAATPRKPTARSRSWWRNCSPGSPSAAARGSAVADPRESAVLQRLGSGRSAARWAELRDEIGRALRPHRRPQSRPQADDPRRILCDRGRGAVEARGATAWTVRASSLDRSPIRPHICALERMMSADRPYFRDDPDLLRERRAASRPRLHDGGVRCAGALHAARWAPGQIPHRHRRARAEGRALGAGSRADAAAVRRPRSPPRSARWTGCSTSATTITSAPPKSAISAACRRCGESWSAAARSISAASPAGTACATRPSTTRANWSTARGPGRADRRRGRMGRRGKLFLPAVGLAGPAAGLL